MVSDASYRLETLAVHAGQEPDPLTGAVMPSIVLLSTFAQQGPGEHLGYDYSRSGNPTRATLEKCLAALEGAHCGLAFGSGCAATTALLHTLRPGDHVIFGDDVYGGTYRLFHRVMEPLGILFTSIDMTDLNALRGSLTPATKMVWVETPSNPMLKITDIQNTAAVCKKDSIRLVIDNTFATPVGQQPLALGATAVVHSTTKYLNGHSDVVGGFIATNDQDLEQELRFLQNSLGGVPSPFDCFLVLRGVKTLPVRMQQHLNSAADLATRMQAEPLVERVIYPGLVSHVGHETAKRQMNGFGGMISFELRGGLESSRAFLKALRVFTCAESLGGVESLAEHPALMTHASIPASMRASLGITNGLIRLSVGLEHVEDLWTDLRSALQSSTRRLNFHNNETLF